MLLINLARPLPLPYLNSFTIKVIKKSLFTSIVVYALDKKQHDEKKSRVSKIKARTRLSLPKDHNRNMKANIGGTCVLSHFVYALGLARVRVVRGEPGIEVGSWHRQNKAEHTCANHPAHCLVAEETHPAPKNAKVSFQGHGMTLS